MARRTSMWACLLVTAACTPTQVADDDAGDGSTNVVIPDIALDATNDAGPTAACGDITNAACWTLYDFRNSADAGQFPLDGYWGGGFDGRYAYYVPNLYTNEQGRLVRYDKTQPYQQLSSWAFYDMSQVDARARGYSGAAFDGTWLYLAPYANGTT